MKILTKTKIDTISKVIHKLQLAENISDYYKKQIFIKSFML